MAKPSSNSLKVKLLKKNKKDEVSKLQETEFKKIQFFTKFQASRYGFYRRSDLKKEKVKKIIGRVNPFLTNINSSDPLVMSIKGITKFFIGEIIEISKEIMHRKNDTVEWVQNPIQISHIDQSIKEVCRS
jgi:xanthosine utilization system XapX-like protein